MSTGSVEHDKRGISEIYGTLLVIALAFAVSVVIIGAGFLLLDDSIDESNSQQGQDSIQTFDDRVSAVQSAAEQESNWQPPEGTAENFEASEDDGIINITVETTDEYWYATEKTTGKGELVDSNEKVNYTEFTVGTIKHEGKDGLVTAYQGGAVFQRQDDRVSVIEEPSISVDQERLRLSLVELSSLPPISDGTELNIEGSEIDTNVVQQIVDAAIKRDGKPVAEAKINMTVRSEYADGWAAFGEERLDGATVWTDLPELDDDQVKIGFGTFGDGIDVSSDFVDPIIYSGTSEFAPDRHNYSRGTLDDLRPDSGFDTADPSQPDYSVGIYAESPDPDIDESEWWVYNFSSDRWENVERSNKAPESTQSPTHPDFPNVPTGSDTFRLEDDTITCVVKDNPDNFDQYVDAPNQDCMETMIAVDDPNELVAEFKPYLEVTNVAATDLPSGDTNLSQSETFDVDVEVTNSGPGDANNDPVGMFFNPLTGPVGEVLVAGDRVNTPKDGGTDSLSFDDVSAAFLLNTSTTSVPFEVGAATANDRLTGDKALSVSQDGLVPPVDIEGLSLDSGNSSIVAGETVHGEIAVNNTDSSPQEVAVLFRAGNSTAGLVETVSPGPVETYDFQIPTLRTESSYGNVTAAIPGGDAAKTNITVSDPDTTPEFEVNDVTFTPTNRTVQVGETLGVTASVTNTGSVQGPPQVVQFATSSPVVTLSGNGSVSLAPGQTTDVSLDWTPTPRDVGTLQTVVFTPDDSSTPSTVEVEPAPETNADFAVDIDDSATDDEIVAGDNLTVEATVENVGNETETQSVWLASDSSAVVLDETTLTLSPGSSQDVTFTWNTERSDSPGGSPPETDISVSSPTQSDTKSVIIRGPDNDGDLTLTNLDPDQTVTEGEDVDVTAIIENTDSLPGSAVVILENLDGDPVDAVEVSLDSGNDTTVDLTWSTVLGDADDGTVTAVLENQTATAAVEVEEQQNVRDPLDVVFTTDESGSMIGGAPPNRNGYFELSGGYTRTLSSEPFKGAEIEGDISYGDGEVWRATTSGGDVSYFRSEEWFDPRNYDQVEIFEEDSYLGQNNNPNGATVPAEQVWLDQNLMVYFGPGETVDAPSGEVDMYELDSVRTVTDPEGEFGRQVNDEADFYTYGNTTYRKLSGTDSTWLDSVQDEWGPVGSISDADASKLTAWNADYGALPDTVPQGQSWRSWNWLRTGESWAYNTRYVRVRPHGQDALDRRFDATQQFVGELNRSMDQVGYVQFDNNARTIQDLTDDFDAFNSTLSPDRGGGTYMEDGIQESIDVLTGSNADPDHEKIVVLLGDGLANDNPERAARDAADENITIYTVGLGAALEEVNDGKEELKQIANITGGEFFFAENASELNEKFSQIADNTTEFDGPEFEVDVTGVNPGTTVARGDTVEVRANVTNVGDTDGVQPVWLTESFDGTVVDSQRLNIENDSMYSVGLEWEAELSDSKFDASGEAPGELVFRSGSDNESVNITVEDRPSNFEIDSASVKTSQPVDPTSVVTINASVDNTLNGADEQDIWLRAPWGAPVDGETVSLGPNGATSSDIQLQWNLSEISVSGDTLTLNVSSEDDSRDVDIDIASTDDVPEFEITGLDTNADINESESISAGEDLDADVTIENVGNQTGQQFIELRKYDNTSVDGELLSLDPGSDKTLSLTWETWPIDEGDRTITVVPGRGDSVRQDVNITEYDPDASFNVNIDDTNASVSDSESVEAGVHPLTVDATIEHSGTDSVRVIAKLNNNGTGEIIPTLKDLGEMGPSNRIETVNFSYQTTPNSKTVDELEVTVERFDGADTTDVNITEQDIEPDVNITSIETTAPNRSAAATAGEDAVDIEVEFASSEDPDDGEIVSVYEGTTTSPDNLITFTAYDSAADTELTWQPLPGDGDNTAPRQITITAGAAEETKPVYINEAPDELIGGAGETDGPDPVGIDVDEIQVSS